MHFAEGSRRQKRLHHKPLDIRRTAFTSKARAYSVGEVQTILLSPSNLCKSKDHNWLKSPSFSISLLASLHQSISTN
jgi:hypothetical protein